MRKSRRKFTKLRQKVQKVREAKTRLRETEDPAEFLQDWGWNFAEKETPEDIFADGIHIFMANPVASARHSQLGGKSGKSVKSLPSSTSKSKSSQLILMTSSAVLQSSPSSLPKILNGSEDNQHSLRRINRHKADKFANRLRMRCQAKQPMQRGRM